MWPEVAKQRVIENQTEHCSYYVVAARWFRCKALIHRFFLLEKCTAACQFLLLNFQCAKNMSHLLMESMKGEIDAGQGCTFQSEMKKSEFEKSGWFFVAIFVCMWKIFHGASFVLQIVREKKL